MSTAALTQAEAASWATFQRMRVRLSGVLGRELAQATGLSEAELEILTAIDEQPDKHVRALALRCGIEWEKSRLSHQLRRMEKRGLVQRETCTEDARGSVVRLTEEGRRRATEARACYESAVRRHVVDVLSPEQLAALEQISETLLARVEARPHS